MSNGTSPGVGAYGGAGNVMNEQEALALAGMGGQFGMTPTGADQLVYLGQDYEGERPKGAPGVPGSAAYLERRYPNQALVPVDVAKARVGFFNDAERKRISKFAARYYGNDYAGSNPSYWASLWGLAIDNTTVMAKATQNNKLSVWDTLESMADTAGALREEKSAGGAGRYTGPVTTVRLTDPDTAMTLIDQSLQGALGRSASEQERNRFLKALREYEMKNPYVSTGDKTGSITTGGSNAQAFAQRYAQAQEGAAEYESATTFLDAFLGALGNPVR
jgi:hypothetical protein